MYTKLQRTTIVLEFSETMWKNRLPLASYQHVAGRMLTKKRYSGMDAELLRRFKELARENAELKRMYADLSLDHRILKNVIEKKF